MNNNIECVFEEYEKELQKIIVSKGIVNESISKLFDVFKHIVDTFEVSLNYATHKVENNIGYIKSLRVPVDGFLENPSFYILFIKKYKEGGSFIPSNCYYDTITDKMCEAKFIYYERTKDYPSIDMEEFKKTMFHELHHAYRQYQILKQEEINKEENLNQNIKNQKVKNSDDIYQYTINNDTLLNIIKNIHYCTNIDEIDSHFNEIFPYIETHKEINTKNYKNYLNNIPGYEIILKLKKYQDYFNNGSIEKLKKVKEQIGNGFYEIYKNDFIYQYKKLTPDKCFYMTKNKVNDTLLYAQNKFYRYLYDAFNKLNR